jgi:hypothetical protein
MRFYREWAISNFGITTDEVKEIERTKKLPHIEQQASNVQFIYHQSVSIMDNFVEIRGARKFKRIFLLKNFRIMKSKQIIKRAIYYLYLFSKHQQRNNNKTKRTKKIFN